MKISVALCTYNGEKFLHQQIDSILNQSVKVDEIVICDDGSQDQTQKILSEYKKQFPESFNIHINEKNLRSVKNFEKAISLCTGDIIFLSDQDDVWLPEKVDRYLNYFSTNPEISVVCSNGLGIDEDDKFLDVLTIWDIPELVRKKQGKVDYFEIIAYINNIATGASMAIRKNFIREVIPFPDVKGFHHDEWIALIASARGKFELLDEKLFKYRAHNNQQVGGVFYDKSRKEKLIKYHILDNNNSFSYYKSVLKRLSNAHKKFSSILENDTVYKEFLKENINKTELLFNKYRNDFKKNHLIMFYILSIFDRFSKKRKLP